MSDGSQLDKITVSEDDWTLDKISVDKMTLDDMSVDKMSFCRPKMFLKISPDGDQIDGDRQHDGNRRQVADGRYKLFSSSPTRNRNKLERLSCQTFSG